MTLMDGSSPSVAGWMPARFDHELSAYRLTGQHRDVRCDRCHAQVIDPDASSGETYRLLKGVGYVECSDCHRDPHEGRLGEECESRVPVYTSTEEGHQVACLLVEKEGAPASEYL